MKLVVVGAGGRTGRLIVERALAAGHHVTAFVRRPDQMITRHERLSVTCGDVLDPDSLSEAVAGQEAVVSALGVKSRTTTTVFSAGITNVAKAMEFRDVRRILALSSAGLDIGPHMPIAQRLIAEYIVERVMRNIYLDLARMEDELETHHIDWTIVRATALTDGPANGRYRVALDGGVARPKRLSRSDLAAYVVDQLDNPETYRKKVMISN
jgi:putative NADH-flavin reductase